ncbi:MAG: DUF4097 family beta strand repeat-containing protein [Oscillochloridaceae bacterium umkhey_bin13]
MQTDPRPNPGASPTDAPQGSPTLPNESYYQRSDQARRWGGLLVIFGVIWLVFELTTRGSLFGVGLGFVEQSQPLPTQRYTAQQVIVNGVSDEVTITGWNEDQIQVEVIERGFGWNAGAARTAIDQLEVLVEQRDSTLQIDVRRPPALGIVLGRSPYAEIRIALPAEVAVQVGLVSGPLAVEAASGSLQLSTVSGDITVQASSGALQANTTSGTLRVRDFRGPLRAETVSGDVRIEATTEGVSVETVSGDVRLEQVQGPLDLRNISGDLDLESVGPTSLQLETTSGDIAADVALIPASTNRISTISGDVRLHVRDPQDLRLEASTASGDLRIDLAGRERTEERRRLGLTIGEGSTTLSITTTSGDVRVSGE